MNGARSTDPSDVAAARARVIEFFYDDPDPELVRVARVPDLFSVGWAAPHRVLKSCIEAASAFSGEVVGQTVWGEATMPIERFSVMSPKAETSGKTAAMALYAGRSVDSAREVKPARDIVSELTEGAERLLRGAASTIATG